MARPSMPNRTRIRSAIRTIAWPSCNLRCGDLVRVLGTINGICRDDDVVADNLLDDRCDRLERVPERHLDGLVPRRGRHVVTADADVGRRIRAEAATRAVRRAVACGAGISDEDPSGGGGRLLRRALGDAA